MEIIDAHTHLYHPGEYRESSLWPSFEARLDVLREAGVSRALACRGEPVHDCTYDTLLERNQRIAASCAASDGFYVPSAEIQPALGEPACELLRRCRDELGMRFVGEMFDRWLGYQWGTPDYHRLLECAADLRMVPLIHCEDDVAREIGERHPEGRFVIAHLMGGYENRVEAIMPYPHLYLDISGSDIARAGAIKHAVSQLGSRRVLFGSDLGGVDPVVAVACVRRSGLEEDVQSAVFAGNFHRLWGWTEGKDDV
jgi:predicted TIM-barrel fold metal-dependent hydrolase